MPVKGFVLLGNVSIHTGRVEDMDRVRVGTGIALGLGLVK